MVPSSACSDAGDSDDEDPMVACTELMQQLEAGGELRESVLDALQGNVAELAFDVSACRVVQQALEIAEPGIVISFTNEMQGRILDALICPHANHVLQKIIQVLPASHMNFLIREIIGSAVKVARHRYGCRALSQLIARHSELSDIPDSMISKLIGELLCEAAALSRHPYSHFVILSILDSGVSEHLNVISEALRTNLMQCANTRAGAHVLERALLRCCSSDRDAMAGELFASASSLARLVESHFGCSIAKGLLGKPGPHLLQMASFLEEARPLLQSSKYGRRVLEEFKRVTV